MYTILKILAIMAALTLGSNVALGQTPASDTPALGQTPSSDTTAQSQTSPSDIPYPSYTTQRYPQMRTFVDPAPGTEYRWDGNHYWYWTASTGLWSFWNGRGWTAVLSPQSPPLFINHCRKYVIPKY